MGEQLEPLCAHSTHVAGAYLTNDAMTKADAARERVWHAWRLLRAIQIAPDVDKDAHITRQQAAKKAVDAALTAYGDARAIEAVRARPKHQDECETCYTNRLVRESERQRGGAG